MKLVVFAYVLLLGSTGAIAQTTLTCTREHMATLQDRLHKWHKANDEIASKIRPVCHTIRVYENGIGEAFEIFRARETIDKLLAQIGVDLNVASAVCKVIAEIDNETRTPAELRKKLESELRACGVEPLRPQSQAK